MAAYSTTYTWFAALLCCTSPAISLKARSSIMMGYASYAA
jgi:hypothetical protein